MKETKELWVERTDVMIQGHPDFYRIHPGSVVRLKYSLPIHILTVEEVNGQIIVKATTQLPEGTNIKKIKATINWLSVKDSVDMECRLYEDLFVSNDLDFDNIPELKKRINPSSKTVTKGKLNREIAKKLKTECNFQFERQGFFALDLDSDLKKNKIVFNRVLE